MHCKNVCTGHMQHGFVVTETLTFNLYRKKLGLLRDTHTHAYICFASYLMYVAHTYHVSPGMPIMQM